MTWLHGALVGTALLCAGCATAQVSARCGPPVARFTPWDMHERPEPGVPDPPGSLADAAIAGYQTGLRAPGLPGTGCRLIPSCSRYGKLALRRHGAIAGVVLIADRFFVREHAGMQRHYVPACHVPRGEVEVLLDPVP